MGRHCEHERQQRQRRRYAAALGKDSPAHLSRRVAPCGGGGGGNGDACGAQRYMARVATSGTHKHQQWRTAVPPGSTLAHTHAARTQASNSEQYMKTVAFAVVATIS